MLRVFWGATALVAMAGAAVAADAPAGGRPGWNREAFQQMRAQHERQRADDIALLIGLTPAQRPALDTFLHAMEPAPHRGGAGWKAHGEGAATAEQGTQPPTTMERLDRMAQMVDRHDAQAKQRIAAARAFYTGLTPDQQRRFDALARLRHDRMGRPGRGQMHGMGGRWRHGPDGAHQPPAAG